MCMRHRESRERKHVMCKWHNRIRGENVFADSWGCWRLIRRGTRTPSHVIACILVSGAAATGCARRVSVRGTRNFIVCYAMLRHSVLEHARDSIWNITSLPKETYDQLKNNHPADEKWCRAIRLREYISKDIPMNSSYTDKYHTSLWDSFRSDY